MPFNPFPDPTTIDDLLTPLASGAAGSTSGSSTTTATPPGGHPPGHHAPPTVVTLTAGSQTYTAGTNPVHIIGNTGNDTITGGTTGHSTMDYSNLSVGVTLTPGSSTDTVVKGASAVDGTDTLANIWGYIGAKGQTNVIDGQGATAGTISYVVDLRHHSLVIKDSSANTTDPYHIVNFETVLGPNSADIFIGDNQNDTFKGGAGSKFTTGTGTNTLTGGGANDTYNFGGGTDTITNFNYAGGDIIHSHSAIKAIVDSTSGAVIEFANGGTIHLTGIAASAVSNSWVVVG